MRLPSVFLCLLIALFFAGNNVRAQGSLFLKPLSKGGTFNHLPTRTGHFFLPVPSNDSVMTISGPGRLPLNFYSTHLGTACKMELRLEKQTGLPIRIRLGSKEQVDYLEGKFNRDR